MSTAASLVWRRRLEWIRHRHRQVRSSSTMRLTTAEFRHQNTKGIQPSTRNPVSAFHYQRFASTAYGRINWWPLSGTTGDVNGSVLLPSFHPEPP